MWPSTTGFTWRSPDSPRRPWRRSPSWSPRASTSLKLFMAYKGAIMVDDATLLQALQKGKECGALVCVHAENGDVIDVLVKEHVAAGKIAPKYHYITRPPAVESEATRRAIMLAEIAGAPIYIVHVSCTRALDEIRAARDRGQAVVRRDVPTVSRAVRRRLRRPRIRGCQVHLLAAPARQVQLGRACGPGSAPAICRSSPAITRRSTTPARKRWA